MLFKSEAEKLAYQMYSKGRSHARITAETGLSVSEQVRLVGRVNAARRDERKNCECCRWRSGDNRPCVLPTCFRRVLDKRKGVGV